MNEFETPVTMVFIQTKNPMGIEREMIEDLIPNVDEGFDELLELLKKVKDHITLKDWGIHDIDDDGYVTCANGDADLLNSYDESYTSVTDEMKYFAEALCMGIVEFTDYIYTHWAIAVPLSVEDLKKKLGI